MENPENQILLGIDTGGTYTDAVLFSYADGVLKKAKSLTTRHDLSVGISGAVDAVIQAYSGNISDIALVSMSTTLATNALVEGKGGSVGLVMIGFDREDAEKSGLREALGGDPAIFVPGGHDVQGNEKPLDIAALEGFVEEHRDKVSGFAVAGYFAVRNPDHELKVREFLSKATGAPVTCSHELSSKLGGPKRALTTLLNARLIPVIRDLIQACQKHIGIIGIKAPLMVVRGDGTLVDASFALNRPIETILSGPAASLIGAKFLLGRKNAVVSDIGGTTTDVAILEKGWPRINPEGASVGGFTTMVEAVAMHTFGLGGDSAVSIDDTQETGLFLGPRRQIPLSLLAMEWKEIVFSSLERQLGTDIHGIQDGKFAFRVAGLDGQTGNLKSTEEKLLVRLTEEPQPLDTFLKGASEAGTLNRLVSKGLAQLSGFTPSDAMHVLELQDNWNGDAALFGAQIFARSKDRYGRPVAKNAQELCHLVKDQLTKQSCDVILRTCMSEDKIPVGPGAVELISRALQRKSGIVRFAIDLDRSLVGLGASAETYYPAIGEKLATECQVPDHADVANAIGAVASEVRIKKSITVSSADGGSSFSVLTSNGIKMFAYEKQAVEKATADLEAQLLEMVLEAGAIDPQLETEIQVDAPEIEGSRHFIEARILITATGRPRIDLGQ
ncbi:MAG: hydantoinase/oxoprolinase N-terminal domain-containing protein [Rhizobiaceae bacterium]